MDVIEEGKSAFNSAVQFMMELAAIRRRLHEARWCKDTEARGQTLISYYVALVARMKRPEMLEKHKQYYDRIKSDLKDYQDGINHKKRVLSTTLFSALDAWEIELRRDENALGLLVPDKDDPRFAH